MKQYMKKVMAVVFIGIMVLSMTACGTKKSNKCGYLEPAFTVGVEQGEIKWKRHHYYGCNNYDNAIEWRQYRKQQGDWVSEITWDDGHGARTYWFEAGQIAE